jgi:hypothetical protein
MRIASHPVIIAIGTATLLAAAACGTPDTGSDSALVAGGVADSARTVAGLTSGKKPPGKLDKMPEAAVDEWKTYVNALAWSPFVDRTDERGCMDAPNVHSKDCNLEITAVDGAILVGPDDYDDKDAGRVLARIRNVGTKEEAVYGVKPGETVYIQVMRKNDKKIVGRIVTIDAEIRVGAKKATEYPFSRCGHASSDTLQHESVAKMAFCSEMAPRDTGSVRTKALGPLVGHNRPAWITCAQGCCVVEEP